MRSYLIQSVISVGTDDWKVEGVIDLQINANVTDDWAGTMATISNTSVAKFSDGFAQVVREFQAKTPIEIPNAQPCENCSLTVQVSGYVP